MLLYTLGSEGSGVGLCMGLGVGVVPDVGLGVGVVPGEGVGVTIELGSPGCINQYAPIAITITATIATYIIVLFEVDIIYIT